MTIVNLLTDLDLGIISGDGELDGLATHGTEWPGKHLQTIFPSVAPDYLEQVKRMCLQFPDKSHELNLQVGFNGHARQFHWMVCSRKSVTGKPDGFLWVGTEVPNAQHLAYQQRMQAAIMERLTESVITFDTAFCITSMNRQAEALFGIAQAQAVGSRMSNHYNMRMLNQNVQEAIQELQATGQWKGIYIFEKECQEPLYVAGSMSQVKDEQGQLIGYLAIDRNITEEVKLQAAQKQVDEQKHILANIIDQSGALAWATDSAGKKRFVNKPYRAFAGLATDAEAVALDQLFDVPTARRYQAENELVISTGKTYSALEPVQDTDGTTRWYRTFKFPVTTSEGVLAAGFAYDVTGEQQQEQELAYLRKRFEVAASITADIIADWDIINDRLWRSDPINGILVHPTKAASMQERFGRLHPEDRPDFIFSLNQALLSDAAKWDHEYRYMSGSDDGNFKLLHEQGVIIRDEAGEAVRMISVVVDVTEERRLQQEIRRKEKLVIAAHIEGQDNERNELARELHDNVGQVLAMCKLFVEIAADSVQHEYLGKCREHLERAIREIRSLSHRLSPVTLDRMGLPGAIADLVSNINQTGKMHLLLEVDEALHHQALEKPVKNAAYRIIQEAVSNILKHADATEAVISLKVEAGFLNCQVADNGKGFNIKKAKTGIGLRNIENRVEFLNGRLAINSAPGEGCMLEVNLPA